MSVTKDKRTNLWKFRTYITDSLGNRKQHQRSGFKTKKEALKAEQDFIKEHTNSCDMTFGELWNIYEKHIKLKLKYNSYRTIKNRIETHALQYFKDYKLSKIDSRIYTNWQAELEDAGYSYKYKSSLHGAIRTMLNYGIKFYGLKNNIASSVGNFSKRNEIPKEHTIWTHEEFKKFINAVDNDMYKLFFETLFYTGLRLGECLALNWNDLKGNYIIVNKTLTRNIKNGKKTVNSPKTATSYRKVKISNYLLNRLKEYKEKCHKYVEFENGWYIFGNINPLSTTTVERKKNKYCKLAQVKQIKIHDFRHSHASQLLSSGVPITAISQRLGHSDIEMTLNTYSHMLQTDEDKVIDVLDNLNYE